MGKIPVCRGFLKRLCADAAGGVGTLVALSLPVVIGTVGLAYDVNRGLEQRIVNQRAADMAALGAAMAYKATNKDTVLQATATDIAKANGLSGAGVDLKAAVVNDFPNAGDKAVKVTIKSEVPYTLARVVGAGANYDVAATSIASLVTKRPVPPCFLALADDDDAIATQGGASVNAPNCSIAAVGSIDHGGSSITAHEIISGSGDITTSWGTIVAETLRFAGNFNTPNYYTGATVKNKYNQANTLVDPWASNSELINARSELGDFTTPPTLTDPDTDCSGAEDWTLDSSPNDKNPAFAYFTKSDKKGTYNFPAGTYCIGKLSVGGGVTVNFAGGSSISIDQGFSNGGDAVDFGDSELLVNGGFNSGNGVSIGDGLLWIGHGNVNFQGANTKGDGDVIINDTLSLGGGQTFTMGSGRHLFGAITIGGGSWANIGDGDFAAVSGVDVGGGSELSVGAGDVVLGSDKAGNAIKLAGSGRFFMEDGQFSANGDINTEGGSRLVFGRTANHYINGDMLISGGVLFGAGRYTINGDFRNGKGGTVWPYTSSVTNKTYGSVSLNGFDMVGVDVTFILAGTVDLAGGARTNLTAASATGSGAFADLIFDSLTTTDTSWAAGATNVFNGVAHFPNSDVKMAGGVSTTGADANFCFRLVANRIDLAGGATAHSACSDTKANTDTSANSIRLLK